MMVALLDDDSVEFMPSVRQLLVRHNAMRGLRTPEMLEKRNADLEYCVRQMLTAASPDKCIHRKQKKIAAKWGVVVR